MNITYNFYFGWILYDFLCGILMLIMSKRVARSQKEIFVGCFFFCFIILAIWGNIISPDYWNYVSLVEEIAATRFPTVHMEDFYIWLIHKTGNNFYLYQFCVYVPQFALMYLIFTKGCHLTHPILFLLIFAILVLYSSIVGRNFLFTAVYLSALALIANRKFIVGIILLASSFIFHKLAYIALPLAVLYFIPLRINRKSLTVLAILFISALAGVNFLLNNYFLELFLSLENVDGRDYLLRTEGANAGGSLWWQVIYAYQIGVKFLLAFIVLYHLRRMASSTLFSFDRIMYVIVFWCSLASFFFYCVGLPDRTIAGRIFSIGLIPLCYLFSKLPDYIQIKRWHKMSFYLICIFYLLFNNAYIVGVSHSILG